MRIITQSHLSHLDEMEALRLKLKNEHAQIAFCQADAAAIAMKDFAQTKESEAEELRRSIGKLMKKVGFLAQQLAEKREEFDKLNATIIAATNVEEPRVAVAAEPQSMKETHYNTEFLDGASPGLSMQIIVPKAPVTVGIPLTTPCVPQLPPGIPIRAAPRFPPGIPIPHAPLGIPVGCTPRFPPGIPIQPAPPGITIPTSPCAPPKIAFPCLPLPPAVGIPFNIGMIQYHGMKILKNLGEGGNGECFLVKMLNNGSLKVAKVVKFHANMRMVELNNGNSAPMEIYALQLAKKNNLKGSIHYSFHYDVRINSDRFFIIGMEWMDGWILLHDYLLSNPDLCDDDRKTLWLNNVENGKELYNIGLYHGDVKPENILMDPVTRRCKFIDFGSAAIVDDDAWLQIFCGTWHGQEMSFSDRRWNIQSGPCESFAFGALYLQMFHPLADNMYFTENSIESYFAQHRHFIPREAQKVIYELMKADPKKRLRLEHIHEYLQIQPNTHSHPFPSRLKFVIQSGFFIEPPAVNSIQ